MKTSKNINIFSKTKRIIAAKICFIVFCTKMLITATPIFVDVLDKGTILQIVMQLEVEQTSKGTNTNNEDLYEHGVKLFKPDALTDFAYYSAMENKSKQRNYLRNEKGICSYHPSVPTPPPNC